MNQISVAANTTKESVYCDDRIYENCENVFFGISCAKQHCNDQKTEILNFIDTMIKKFHRHPLVNPGRVWLEAEHKDIQEASIVTIGSMKTG